MAHAHFATQHYPEAKRFYDKKAAKTNGIVAIKALAHKLARAEFHVLRDKQPFDPKKVFVDRGARPSIAAAKRGRDSPAHIDNACSWATPEPGLLTY